MPRRPVEVRRAAVADVPVMQPLVLAACEEAGDAQAHLSASWPDRLADVLERADLEVYLAMASDVAVGVAVVRFGDVMILSGGSAVRIEQLYVDPQWRRRGIAHLLMNAALAAAERWSADEITCVVPSSGRDAHRFLARLGFGRVVTLRATPVGRLRARLAAEGGPGRRRLALDALVARRRRQLDRPATPPSGMSAVLPPRPAGSARSGASSR